MTKAQSHHQINFSFHLELPNGPLIVLCDDHQIRQMFTNLIQNSIDSITARENNGNLDKGIVKINTSIKSNFCHLKIIDNGIGLPAEISNRLTEPYVTTREKGTGLGLAIVAKIVEDHGGILKIQDVSDQESGVVVTITIPLVETQYAK